MLAGRCQSGAHRLGEPLSEDDGHRAIAAAYSRGCIFQSFSARFKTRNRSFYAASSLRRWRRARTARRCFKLRA